MTFGKHFYYLVPSWLNRNVALNIAYTSISSAASSLTLGSFAFSNLLVSLPNQSDETVGNIAATGGICMVLLALPIGVLTDRYKRSTLLRIATIIGFASACVFGAALWTRSIAFFYIASALDGVFQAVSGPVLAASFADALPMGGRTTALTVQQAASLFSRVIGPALAAIALQSTGNSWNAATLITIMGIGNVLGAVALCFLPLILDSGSLGNISEGALGRNDVVIADNDSNDTRIFSLGKASEGIGGTIVLGGQEPAESTLKTSLLINAAADTSSSTTTATAATTSLGTQTLVLPFCLPTLTVASIPWLIFLSDMVIACGAGMTIAFFPLYFSQNLLLSPVTVAIIFACAPLFIAIVSLAVLPLSRYFGRAKISLLLDMIGTAGTLVLAVSSLKMNNNIAITIYLIRTAAMNSSYPIQRAILMDVVASCDRGKWSSLENLTSFTWTGSAAFGGWLVEKHGFGFSFLITAIIYIVGCIPLALVIPLTHGEIVDKGDGEKE